MTFHGASPMERYRAQSSSDGMFYEPWWWQSLGISIPVFTLGAEVQPGETSYLETLGNFRLCLVELTKHMSFPHFQVISSKDMWGETFELLLYLHALVATRDKLLRDIYGTIFDYLVFIHWDREKWPSISQMTFSHSFHKIIACRFKQKCLLKSPFNNKPALVLVLVARHYQNQLCISLLTHLCIKYHRWFNK